MATLTRRSVLAAACAGGAALSTPSASAAADSFSNRANADSKFRLGLVTYNLAANWDLPTLLQVCRSVGVTLVELRTGHKHGVEPTLSKEERQSVRKQFLELARDIGAHGVKVRPNGIPKGAAVEKTLQQIGAALAECGRAADEISGRSGGLEVWLEVHGSQTAHPPYIKSIMESCGHPSVGLTWNSNADDIKDGSVAESFKTLWPWVRSCHINDLYKDQTGAYPYRELFGLLKGIGYDRVTLCEVGRTFPDPNLGAEFLRYYKALWTELNRG